MHLFLSLWSKFSCKGITDNQTFVSAGKRTQNCSTPHSHFQAPRLLVQVENIKSEVYPKIIPKKVRLLSYGKKVSSLISHRLRNYISKNNLGTKQVFVQLIVAGNFLMETYHTLPSFQVIKLCEALKVVAILCCRLFVLSNLKKYY